MRKRRDMRMKHNFMTKMVSALLAVVLSTAAFSVTAFASGGEETTEPVAEQKTAGDVSDLLSALAGSQVTVSVTEDGIAQILGIGRTSAYILVKEGHFKIVRIGNAIRISKRSFDEWLDSLDL